jgi:hypothetical protein
VRIYVSQSQTPRTGSTRFHSAMSNMQANLAYRVALPGEREEKEIL